MKKPKVRITPRLRTAKEKKMAKVMEQWINHEYEDNKDFIQAVIRTRMALEAIYAIDTPSYLWDRIMEAGLRLKMNTLLKESSPHPKKEEVG